METSPYNGLVGKNNILNVVELGDAIKSLTSIKIPTMRYLNQFHKESSEKKMNQIAEWRKSPTDLETALANQRKREQIAKEMQN